MKKYLLGLLLTACFLAPARQADAKWWIFGQSQDEVVIKYLLINNTAFDEGGPSATFTPDQLTNGMLYIKGKAKAGKASIGTVQVSIDNKKTWQKAKLSKDGTFEFSFTPENGRAYDVYVKVLDTRGKTNDVDRTAKKVTVADLNIQDLVRRALDGMMEAYSREDIRSFMSHISPDFAGDSALVERAVMQDFTAFNAISMRYTLNNVTRSRKGYVSVSITFNRQVTSVRSGETLSDSGMTEFTFVLEGTSLKVFAMKMPVIFGVSDASSIATGAVNAAGTTQITVDPSGNVSLGGGGSSGTPASMTYNNVSWPWTFESFLFSDGTKSTESWGATNLAGDFGLYGDNHHIVTNVGVTVIDMGVRSLASVTSAPTAGYASSSGTLHAAAGHVYVFKLPGNAYGAIEVVSASIPWTVLRYKYSASGPDF